MRLLIACASTLFLVLVGCNTLVGVATLMAFSANPIYIKAYEAGATKDDLLAIQQPHRVTPIHGAASTCFDYTLRSKGKKRTLYVASTVTEKVSAYGFSTCASAFSERYLSASELLP
ncbi:hypothetical protein [Pseudomonas antarctica]|uniref:hypothetical protein n=1 Tax=Pseudomonas antarctica TaxID=219572 RepID=UPI00387B5817